MCRFWFTSRLKSVRRASTERNVQQSVKKFQFEIRVKGRIRGRSIGLLLMSHLFHTPAKLTLFPRLPILGGKALGTRLLLNYLFSTSCGFECCDKILANQAIPYSVFVLFHIALSILWSSKVSIKTTLDTSWSGPEKFWPSLFYTTLCSRERGVMSRERSLTERGTRTGSDNTGTDRKR